MLGGAPADADGLVLHLDFNAESGGRVTDRVSGAAIPVLRDLDAIDGAIAGRLDGPGDTRSYSFTIHAPPLLAFDALHNTARMTVTITGSEGISVVRNMRTGEKHQLGPPKPPPHPPTATN